MVVGIVVVSCQLELSMPFCLFAHDLEHFIMPSSAELNVKLKNKDQSLIIRPRSLKC